jgi:hypothetical protein
VAQKIAWSLENELVHAHSFCNVHATLAQVVCLTAGLSRKQADVATLGIDGHCSNRQSLLSIYYKISLGYEIVCDSCGH